MVAGLCLTIQGVTSNSFAAPLACFTLTCLTPSNWKCLTIGYPGIEVTYTNNAMVNLTAIAFGVVQNTLNQTVYYTTSTISPPSGGNSTAFLFIIGLRSGNYSITFFAISLNAVAVSTAERLTCYV